MCGYLDDGVISNCGIYEGYIFSETRCCGGVLGVATNASITACYNTTGIVYSENSSGGDAGVVGGVVGSIVTTDISDCYSIGMASGGNNTGGIIGRAISSSIANCYNEGEILSKSSDCIGGLIGYVSSSTIESCYNIGNVSDQGNTSNMGGLVGFIEESTSAVASVSSNTKSSSKIVACYNMGDVSSGKNNGGIVGYIKSSSSALNAYTSSSTITITTCYNTGTISGGSDSYIGGIVGNAYAYANALIVNAKSSLSSATSKISINSCYNTGTLTGNSDYIGGIVGYDLLTTTSDSESSNVSSDSNSSTSISESSNSKAQAVVVTSNCFFLSPTGMSYTNTYGTSSSDLVSTMTSLGIISTLNYRANNDYWKYDTEFTNNGYPVLISVIGIGV